MGNGHLEKNKGGKRLMELSDKNTETGLQELGEANMGQEGLTESSKPTEYHATDAIDNEGAQEKPQASPVFEEDADVADAKVADAGEGAMEKMYEESIKRFREGEVVEGKIIQIDKEFVLVDIGYKSEGRVPIEEFRASDGTINAAVGDTISVMVERWEPEDSTGLQDGAVMLSKEKASRIKVWEDIQKAYEEDKPITGVITGRVKGGLTVDIGVPAFLPGSQVDLRPVPDLDEMVGRTFEFKILKYSRKRSNVVLSRRVLLENARELERAKTLATIHKGKIMDGVVKNITEYGVFVDLGGIDGLLHITDMSWGRIRHPSEMFSVGDSITVKVLDLDLERERVSLGLKQLLPDPWETAEEKYPIGSHVTGKVVSLTDYGAFVELEKGVEGLIHISEMSWTRKIRHPSKIVSVGDTVEAVVLNISAQSRRISLGMKQVVPNPWDVIAEKYPVGTTIEGKIKNITDFGLFIGIDEGIDGLVHISDISWTKRVKHPSELYKKGDSVQAIVLNIDKENERFSLGIKQLQKDPWETVPERYKEGGTITGTVTNVTDFGVFVELEEGIEGLVHVSEISREKLSTPVGKFHAGDIVSAKVLNINSKERRIGLSIKQLEMEEEQDLISGYLNNFRGSPSSLGEILKEDLKEEIVTQNPPDERSDISSEAVDQGEEEGSDKSQEKRQELSAPETEEKAPRGPTEKQTASGSKTDETVDETVEAA